MTSVTEGGWLARVPWWVATGTTACGFASMIWAAPGHFRVAGRISPAMRGIMVVTALGIAWWLWQSLTWLTWTDGAFGWPDCAAFVLGGTGLVLFWWAVKTTRQRRLTLAFSSDLPKHMETGGPYGWVRHPFYASYMMIWVAAAAQARLLAFWLVPGAMLCTYLWAARQEEAKFARSGLKTEYGAYRRAAGMLLPRPQRLRNRLP